MGTSRARRRLHVVEPTHDRHEPAPHEPQKPNSADQADMDVDQADLDASLAGMAMLLRCALKVMKEYEDASPARRDRGSRCR
jgi:hypothetical protein